jgi:hypothetical protein
VASGTPLATAGARRRRLRVARQAGAVEDGGMVAEGAARPSIVLLARALVVAATAGLVTGVVIGGLGGRLAMLVLRLTSPTRLHGAATDDGFTIGIVSSATFFLLLFTAILGLTGGVVYLVIRGWIPPRARSLVFGALSGVVGGALVVRPNGIDFTMLRPLPLALAMFVALPAAYGVAVSALIERWLPRSKEQPSRAWLAGVVPVILPVALIGLRGGFIFLAVPLVVAVALFRPAATRLMGAPITVWLGRIGLLAVAAGYAIALGYDIAEVL